MKRVTSIHPQLLGAVPNPPHALVSDPTPNQEPLDAHGFPTEADAEAAASRKLASRRHQRGRSHLAAVINHWMGRSGLSHHQLGAIADWAMNEKGWLGSSQLSHLRNGRLAKGASLANLDALAAANLAIWRWQAMGQPAARMAYGPQSVYGIQEAWLDDAIWLPVPEHPEEPLQFADWAEIAAGHLQLPYLGGVSLSPSESRDLSQRLAALFDQMITESGLGLRAGLAAVLAAYPGQKEKARLAQLKAVILGEADYTQPELEVEMFNLAETVRRLRKQPEGSYGPGDLHAELTADRRRI